MNAIRDGDHIRVYDAFRIKDSLKEIPGRFYDADDKAWVVPYSAENAAMLGMLGAALDETLQVAQPQTEQVLEEPLIPMPIKAKPYQHQIRSYNFALRIFGIAGGS